MTKGAGMMFPRAMPSRKVCFASHPPRMTASAWMKGMDVYAPPKDKEPATRPRARRWGMSGTVAIPRARAVGEGTPLKTT